MATQNFSTTIRSKVPECELQAILLEMSNCACFSADLIRLMQNHSEDGGGLEHNEINGSSVEYLGDVAIKMLSKNISMIEVLCGHINVPYFVCDTTLRNILDTYHEDEAKPISAEYKQMLDNSEVA